MKDKSIRLQKFMAEAGIASRRASEKMIAEGKVYVNGKPATIGQKVDPFKDKVRIGGKRIVNKNKKVYIMLNKPRGYVTTMNDEKGRKCVAELVSGVEERVFPVGRLDRDSEGLLIMTNDGEFANNLTHPSKHVNKSYRVTVREDVKDDVIDTLCTGVSLDGRLTLPADVHVIDKGENRTVLQFVISEGRNRQIRRMCEEVGLTVLRLKRVEIAGVRLGMLKVGDWRPLNEREMNYLTNVSSVKRDEA